jgi:hypothetical protein
MTTLDRATILAVDDLPRQVVEVPEWGGSVTVRSMTGAERDELEGIMAAQLASLAPGDRLRNFRALTVAFCAVDDNGYRLFTQADVEALGGKNAAALVRVFTVAQALSALNDTDVEELIKN